MRITANITADNSLYNIQQGRAKLDRITEQIASGNNINRPSDDPIDSRLLLDIGDKVKATDQFTSSISKSSTWLQLTNTALTGMSGTMSQAKSLVATIVNGSSDPTERQSVHDQLVALKQQLVDMGNTQSGDQYLFGGAGTTQPFNYTNNTYAGDSTQLLIEISQNTTQALNITGDRLLKGTGANPSYGSTDILQAFDDMIAAVGDKTIPSNVAGIQTAALAFGEGAKQINNAQSDVATRVLRLDSMNKLNANTRNTLMTVYSNTQNADYAKLGVELTQQQTAFEASLSATAKISQLSLLDYL
jgi:flagellar hook-associated protein 3 FlgL